ncbi:MAG: hypothetical protein KF861_10365 [Planctomycetaceae bacterium]|nr:hypothetical protein [Planctomycetaceae bacterium]
MAKLVVSCAHSMARSPSHRILESVEFCRISGTADVLEPLRARPPNFMRFEWLWNHPSTGVSPKGVAFGRHIAYKFRK